MTISPRTPREFSAAGIPVRLLCRCGYEKRVDAIEFEFSYGEDFDLSRGWVELSNVLRCEACGDRPVVAFGEPDASVPAAMEFVRERPSRRLAAGR